MEWTGERYLPEVEGSIALEHVHRYLAAREFVRGKDVLDVACGEGYGSVILSGVAASVVGVDISEEAVAHAAAKYAGSGVEFLAGSCSALPLPDDSVDCVVSFETIEHHAEHREMMLEIRRVLRPCGLLVISSPDKHEFSDVRGLGTEYHVKELYRDEFEALLRAHFRNVALAGQRVVYGSGIFREDADAGMASLHADHPDDAPVPGMSRPLYCLALASDSALPAFGHSFFEQDFEKVALVGQELSTRDANIAILEREVLSLVEDRDAWKAGCEKALGSQSAAALEHEAERARFQAALSERDDTISRLGVEVESLVADRDAWKAGCERASEERSAAVEHAKERARLESALSERDDRIAGLDAAMASLVADRDAVKAGYAESLELLGTREQENDSLTKELAAMRNSLSWRMTSPVRKLVDIAASVISFAGRRFARRLPKQPPMPETVAPPVAPSADAEKRHRILLVSYYCPTRAHAGGLRILDIYALIKAQSPDTVIDVLTHHRPEIDWDIEPLHAVFDNVYLSPVEDLTPAILRELAGQDGVPMYDVVDLQFHQAALRLNEFRAIGRKVVFTPMESQARVLHLELAGRSKAGEKPGLTRMATQVVLAAEEIVFSRDADEVVCVSSSDAEFLRRITGNRNIRGIATGLSRFEFAEALGEGYEPLPASERRCSVLYVAYFGSETNVTALRWYLENVHPLVCREVPEYTLTVVGRGDLSVFDDLRDGNVEFVGEVPDLAPYIRLARLGIAPALNGAGFRGKINQYAVLGVPCVASPIAIKGLAYRDGENVIVAESPESFAEGCARLLTDFALNDAMGRAARAECLKNYSWRSKWPELCNVYNIEA
ncbi:MAG: methyltransferase domain-containing protein [Pseudodesulfovibrio sp.]|uniref:methyltransferase domain-containing protein n=1 Tax=Pseudodesulfovibrio sp. TaxID=2035812 RepID=UPI003D0ED4B9